MSQSITTSFSAYWRSNVIPLNTLFYTPSSYFSELFQELFEGDLSSTTTTPTTTTTTTTGSTPIINMQPSLPPSQSTHLSRLYMVSLLDKHNMDIYQNHNLSHRHDMGVVESVLVVQPNDYSQHSPSTKTRGSNHYDNVFANDTIIASTNNVSTSNHNNNNNNNNNNRSSNNHAANPSKHRPTAIQHYQSNMEFYTCARSLWEDQQLNPRIPPHVTNPSLPPPTVEMGNNPLGGTLKPLSPSYHPTTTPSTTPTLPQPPPELKFGLFSSFLDQLLISPAQLNHNIAFNRYVSETPYSSHTSITTQFTLFDENFIHPENQLRDLDPLSSDGIQQQQQIARQCDPLYFHSFITTPKWAMHHAVINPPNQPHHSPYQCVITPIHTQRYSSLIQLLYDTKMHSNARQDTAHYRPRPPVAADSHGVMAVGSSSNNNNNRHDKQNFVGSDTISMFFFFLAIYNAKTLNPATHTVSTAAHHSPTLSAVSATTPTGPFSTEVLKLITIKYLQHSKSTDFLKLAQHVNKLRYDRLEIPQPIFPSYQRYCELSFQLLTTGDENVATNPHFTSRQKAHTISSLMHNHLHILCYDACDAEQVEKMKVIIEQIYVEAQYKLQQTQKLLSQSDQNNANNHNTNTTPANHNHDKVALLDTLFLNNYNYNNDNTTSIQQDHGDPRDPIIIVFELYYQQTAQCHNINNTQSSAIGQQQQQQQQQQYTSPHQMLTNYHIVQQVNDKWREVRNLLNVEIQHLPINKALYYNTQQQKLAMYPLNNTTNRAPLLLKQKINREFLTLLYAFVALHVSELMAQSKWTLGGEAPPYFKPKKQERSCIIQ